MDAYIRDFEPFKIDTVNVGSIEECKNILDKKGDKFQLFHNNIRSLSKNVDELNVVLNEFNYIFDCIVLTETFKLYNVDLFNIPGYDLIYNEGGINKNDGVLIYIKSIYNYNYEIINLGIIKAIKLTTTYNNKTVQIIAIYRSPSLCPISFNSNLNNFLKANHKQYDIDIIVGDMNLNIMDNSNEWCQDYLNILSENGYISTINTYTRVQGNSKSCLDHIFIKTNISYKFILPIVMETQISDHYPVLIQILCQPESELKVEQSYNHKIHINYEKLKNLLGSETWLDVYSEKNVDIAASVFVNKLQSKIENCTKSVNIKRCDMKRNPWITNGIIKSINTKNKLFKSVQRNPENIENLHEYKKYRNRLNELIKKTKTNYYKKQISENKNCPKKLWETVKIIQNTKHKQKSDIKSVLNEQGDIISNKKEMANLFCKHFTEVGQKLASKIKNNSRMRLNKTRLPNSMYLSHTSEEEVKNVINKLKIRKSPGIDLIKSETLKIIVDYMVEPITHLINSCFDAGVFPSVFKMAVIKPMYKAGDKLNVENYRPISLLSNLAKIMETIIKNRMSSFMLKYKIISEQQYGFKEARSTQDAIADIIAKIYKAMDAGEPALCIFVDLAKAFDTVSHRDLLDTLENAGFRGITLKMFESYLTDRMQCVQIENSVSDKKIVCCGVPQGTVLGPILFTLYVNDLFNLGSCGDITSFADDTVIFYKDRTWVDLKHKVENDFKTIVEFFNCKLLTINDKKTHFLPFTCYSKNLPNFNNIQVKFDEGNLEITSVTHIKYLGIIIDPHLKWDYQINSIIKKLRCLLCKFKYFRQYFDIKHLKIMYYALVESHLTYGIIAWGGATNVYLKSLETIQKWILKIIYNKCYTYPSNDLYREAEILDLRQLFCKTMLIHLYNTKKNLQNIHHSHDTRYKINASQVIRTDKTIGQRCYSYISIKIFNVLPADIKKINSLKMYKKKIITWILEQPRLLIHQFIDIKNTYYF